MNGKTAGYIVLGISLVLAVLLLTKTISFILCEGIFACSLVVFGLLSNGYRIKKLK